jgi:hypothetical protein
MLNTHQRWNGLLHGTYCARSSRPSGPPVARHAAPCSNLDSPVRHGSTVTSRLFPNRPFFV